MLDMGKSRKEIVAELGLNPRVAKMLWTNPKLKGVKRSVYKVDVIIEDDTEEVADDAKNFAEEIVASEEYVKDSEDIAGTNPRYYNAPLKDFTPIQ